MDKRFVELGDRFINLDNIAYVERSGEHCNVYFTAEESQVSLSGQEASNLLRHLHAMAKVLEKGPDDAEPDGQDIPY